LRGVIIRQVTTVNAFACPKADSPQNHPISAIPVEFIARPASLPPRPQKQKKPASPPAFVVCDQPLRAAG